MYARLKVYDPHPMSVYLNLFIGDDAVSHASLVCWCLPQGDVVSDLLV